MPDLSQLSIVIPTYNRQSYVLRNIRILSSTLASIYILDGSPDPIPSAITTKFPDNICYSHLPISLLERLRSVLPSLTTRYTVLLGDDDIYIPSTLHHLISFLDSNPFYSSASGLSLLFNSKPCLSLQKLCYFPDRHHLCSPNPSYRLTEHLNNYKPSYIYAVTRTDDWRAAWSIASSIKLPVKAAFEVLYEAAMSVLGPHYYSFNLYWLRSLENPNISTGDISLSTSSPHISNWWLSTSPSNRYTLLEHLYELTRFHDIHDHVVHGAFCGYSRRVQQLTYKLRSCEYSTLGRAFRLHLLIKVSTRFVHYLKTHLFPTLPSDFLKTPSHSRPFIMPPDLDLVLREVTTYT